jgi:uncharacterized integral membrane protein
MHDPALAAGYIPPMPGDFEPGYTAYATDEATAAGEPGGHPSGTAGPSGQRQGSGIGFLIGAIAAAALVTFGFQNTASVPVRFLWFDGSVPLWFAMAAAALGAVAVTVFLIGGSARKRRRARRRTARAAAA